MDGKTVRGAVDVAGNRTHLLAAATHSEQLVLGQVEVGAKTNEIPMFASLLDSLAATGTDLSGLVVTADALHCQRSHAEYLHQHGAGFVFTVKQNQPALYAALDALPWAEVPIGHREVDHGHGRITTRTIQVRGPLPRTCRSRMSSRCGWWNATSTIATALRSPRSPRSASPPWAPTEPAQLS